MWKYVTGKVNRASVCQMSAVIQVHSHDGITRLQQCELYCHVCLSTGMWLYVDVLAAEQLLWLALWQDSSTISTHWHPP